jgi:tetratricopeptide (TPR) repeat protein
MNLITPSRARFIFALIVLITLSALALAVWLSPRPSAPLPPPSALELATLYRQRGQTMPALYYAAQAGEHELQGDLWAGLGDLRRAAFYWGIAARASGAVPRATRQWRKLADAAVTLSDWPQAVDALEQLLQVAPYDAWAHLQLGMLRAATAPENARLHLEVGARTAGYTALAEALLATAALNDPLERALKVGQVVGEAGYWDYAEYAFRQAALIGGAPSPLALASIGYARAQQGKSGVQWLEQALSLAPEDGAIYALYGLYLRALGDDEGSLQALLSATTLSPNRAEFYVELGRAYQRLNDNETAEVWLRYAVQVGQNALSYRQVLAQFYAEVSLTNDGLSALESLLTQDPQDPHLLTSAAWAQYQQGDIAGALARLELALSFTPNAPRALYYQARIWIGRGLPEDVVLAREALNTLSQLPSEWRDDAVRLLTVLDS